MYQCDLRPKPLTITEQKCDLGMEAGTLSYTPQASFEMGVPDSYIEHPKVNYASSFTLTWKTEPGVRVAAYELSERLKTHIGTEAWICYHVPHQAMQHRDLSIKTCDFTQDTLTITFG